MPTVPHEIKQSLRTAKTTLGNSLSSRNRVAQYKLLIDSWRQYEQAADALHNWIYTPDTSPLRHSKAEEYLRISHIVIVEGRAHATHYTLDDLDAIYGWLLNGRDDTPAYDLFARGWHFDTFERMARNKIEWDELLIKLIEELPPENSPT